ncbi:MAG TPA: sensor domain-containing diguanylate cyclase [Actinomycetota bacterium]|nr:sensor domain-containing diguanylate cyclase [Actinomycetota bacterium]
MKTRPVRAAGVAAGFGERRLVLSSRARVAFAILIGTGVSLLAATFAASAGLAARLGLAAGGIVALVGSGVLARYESLRVRLERSLNELQASRDELQSSLGTLGEALRSTHDLTSLLQVVLETATRAMHASSGAAYLLTNTRTEMTVKCAHQLDRTFAGRRIRVGEGIAGRVAQTRAPMLIPSDITPPAPSDAEPEATTMIAVPLESASHLIGVLALYGREHGQKFTTADLETLMSLARQAAVGIENVLLHQEAQRLSITDGLTGLWNRRYLQMRLAQEVERSIRFRRPLSVVLLDVDFFKAINDRYGHQRGDAVLIELSQRVVRAVRGQVDTLARLGGEEFVLLLPETAAEGARKVCQKILEAVSSEPFGGEGEDQAWVTVSIGCATFPQHGTTPQTLLRTADFAMYEAKARGRNRVVMADELDSSPSGGDPMLPDEPEEPEPALLEIDVMAADPFPDL